jgi:hypothetical protein
MSNKKLATIDLQTGEIVKFDPAKSAMEIHSLDAMERLAMRVKDIEALEKALTRKLEAQREFAEHHRKIFGQGKRTDVTYDSPVVSADDYCKQLGFILRTVQRWCERLLDEAKFEAEKNKIVKRCKELAEMWQSASFSSESVEWYTPENYIEAVREVLGEIDLDPASCDTANHVVKATKIFTQEDDGLNQDWHGRFFLNPPYGKKEGESLAAAFCQKAIAEYDLGNAKAGIILVNSVHSQNWQACLYDFPVCFVDHRIQFVSGDGEENKNPTFQNIFVYLGKNKMRFAEVFSKLGYVMEKIRCQ